MLTRFFNPRLATLMLPLASCSVLAGEDALFLNNFQQPQLPGEIPQWLKTPPAKLDPVLEGLLKQGDAMANHKGTSDAPAKAGRQGKWVFVSLALPETELKAAALEALESSATLVFRGVPPDRDITALTVPLTRLAQDIKRLPPTVVDPTLFTRFDVNAVPTLVSVDENKQERKAKGLPGFSWLSKQDAGDLGQRGPVYGIAEPDMILEIQRRIKAYDWEGAKRHALDNFWASQNDQVVLPAATEAAVRRIDPSIAATEDIVLPDGRTVVHKGQTINPQAILPMRHAYILFDATDRRQLAFAKAKGDELLKSGKPVAYLFSRMDHGNGWDAYNRTASLLNAQIFKLLPAIVERFKVRALPTVVEGDGTALKVSEFVARDIP